MKVSSNQSNIKIRIRSRTSGSVNALPIAIIPDTRMPSVNIGPKKCCIFGVSRNGTTSFEAYTGNGCGTLMGAKAVCLK